MLVNTFLLKLNLKVSRGVTKINLYFLYKDINSKPPNIYYVLIYQQSSCSRKTSRFENYFYSSLVDSCKYMFGLRKKSVMGHLEKFWNYLLRNSWTCCTYFKISTYRLYKLRHREAPILVNLCWNLCSYTRSTCSIVLFFLFSSTWCHDVTHLL